MLFSNRKIKNLKSQNENKKLRISNLKNSKLITPNREISNRKTRNLKIAKLEIWKSQNTLRPTEKSQIASLKNSKQITPNKETVSTFVRCVSLTLGYGLIPNGFVCFPLNKYDGSGEMRLQYRKRRRFMYYLAVCVTLLSSGFNWVSCHSTFNISEVFSCVFLINIYACRHSRNSAN